MKHYLPAFELDFLRAGVSESQIKDEMAIHRDTSLATQETWNDRVNEVIADRLGRSISDEVRGLDDASRLGALLGISERPLPVSTLLRTLDWTTERLERAKVELITRLPTVGMGMFEFQDESLQIGPLETGHEWREAQRDALANQGVSVKEATFIRHLMVRSRSRPSELLDLPIVVRKLLKADLIRATHGGFTVNVDLTSIHEKTIGAFVNTHEPESEAGPRPT